MRGRCWVALDEKGVTRVFKNYAAAVLSKSANIREYPRKDAVGQVRQRVFERADGHCEDCNTLLTWASMHMHEKIHRGDGGEISLENSIAVCYKCHMDIEHGNRKLRFGEHGSGE